MDEPLMAIGASWNLALLNEILRNQSSTSIRSACTKYVLSVIQLIPKQLTWPGHNGWHRHSQVLNPV